MGHPPTQPELARLADAGPVGIMVASATGVIAYANRTLALLLGYTGGDELLGRNVIDLLAPEDLDARPIDPTRVKLGAPAHNERLMLRKDGSHVWTKTITDLGPDGRYLFWLWDLSAHQRLETELREAQKLEAVGLLAAGVAHDLNNLLAVVQGHAELLRAQQLAANGERSLGYIAEAAGRAAELTQKLLAFGRRQVLQPQHVLLGTLLAKNASLLTSLVGDDIALQLDVAPDLDWVDVDPAHVEQAVWNLVTNARQAMPHGGTIKIQVENVLLSADELAALPRARPDARFVAIRVVDTGSGMDAETLRRIFDPFFTTKALGTGLGLSVVHGVVGQSGGVVRVSSKVGEGSRFELCFPRVERTPEQPAVRAHAALAIAASGARSQVLVVEDDPQIRAGSSKP